MTVFRERDAKLISCPMVTSPHANPFRNGKMHCIGRVCGAFRWHDESNGLAYCGLGGPVNVRPVEVEAQRPVVVEKQEPLALTPRETVPVPRHKRGGR